MAFAATVRDNGRDAPLILFVHGNGASRDDWSEAFTLPYLERFSLLAVDLPGYGDTPAVSDFRFASIADELRRFLHGKVAPVVVLGHSMGGPIVTLLAERLPTVSGVVLLEGSLFPDHAAGAVPFANVLEEVEAAASMDPTFGRYVISLRRADPATFDAGMQEIARYARDGDALRRFYGLSMPRVYVAGDEIARGDLDSLERNGVEIRRFPGAGHAVMFDEPDGFYAFLTKWATKVVGEARV